MIRLPRKNHAHIVFGSLAGLTAVILVMVFVAPFYGALDRPVRIVESRDNQVKPEAGSGNKIIVEQFDYNEPETRADADIVPSESVPEDALKTTEQNSFNQSAQGEFEREPARPPLSDLGLATTPKPPEPPAPAVVVDEDQPLQLLQRPVAIAAGKLESQGRFVDLQGIEVIPVEETCQAEDGESWPCGMHARTAFRQWLRARAIMCRLPKNDSRAAITTQCSVGTEDPALWLVSNGWAKAVAGSPYEEAAEKAQIAKSGIYGDKPDAVLPGLNNSTVMPDTIMPEIPGQAVRPQQLDGEFPPAPQNQ
ncbi:thermonuclease family protein [Brucella gallinifaecis]|uniref:thermonuclease family protein n=1 Tax=Brucella gallinifaecis TaxID=215590 RepID=UPI001875B549|nr:thermonuclease family protein [Brucella gallinifaecis]